MRMLRGPMGIASVITSIQRHEHAGERVRSISISRNLELQMLAEGWEYYGDDLETIGTVCEVPIRVDYSLTGNDFIVDTEKAGRHDA